MFATTQIGLAQTPKTAEEYNNRGVTRRSEGNLDGAIEDFTKAISLKGNPIILAAAYNNRANALLSKNDLAGAIADYSKAIESVLKQKGGSRQCDRRLLDSYSTRLAQKSEYHLFYTGGGLVSAYRSTFFAPWIPPTSCGWSFRFGLRQP